MIFLIRISIIFSVTLPILVATAWGDEIPPSLDLGRLFTTPDFRNLVDGIRYRNLPTTPISEAPKPVAAPEPPKYPERIAVKGLIRKPNGETVIWLDRFSTLDGATATPEGVRVQEDTTRKDGIILTLPTGAQNLYRLKPGQVLNTTDQQVREGYLAPLPVEPAPSKKEPDPAPADKAPDPAPTSPPPAPEKAPKTAKPTDAKPPP